MSINDELGPPPPPTKAKYTPPPMPPEMAKKFPAQAAKVNNGGGGGQPMMMAAQNGYPMVGGMGPNLVFNFYNPGGPMMCQPQQEAEQKKDEGPPPPPMRVQGDPTWCQPRVTVGVGKPVKESPCCIM